MSKMQTFHNRLFLAHGPDDPYLSALLQLTHAKLTRVKAVSSLLDWDQWGEVA